MNKPPREEFVLFMKKCIALETGKQIVQVNEEDTFHSLGLDSINSILVMEKMENEYGIELNPIYFWDYPTIKAYTDFIFDEIYSE